MSRPATRIELRAALRRWARAVRRMAGMPDYASYLEHLRRHHPDEPASSAHDYYADYVAARYGDSPTRCC